MRYDVYGRFQIEVHQYEGRWKAFKLALGKKRELKDIAFPEDMREDEIAIYLDDLFHELARPGDSVKLICES